MAGLNAITGQIIESGLRIHTQLGPGLMESVCEKILARDLATWKGLRVERQKPISFEFDGLLYRNAWYADLVVEDWVVVEVKSVETVHPAHLKQLLTYLRLLDCEVGLLLNFGAALFKQGIHRVVNNFHEPDCAPHLDTSPTPHLPRTS